MFIKTCCVQANPSPAVGAGVAPDGSGDVEGSVRERQGECVALADLDAVAEADTVREIGGDVTKLLGEVSTHDLAVTHAGHVASRAAQAAAWRRIVARDLEGRWGSRSIQRHELDGWVTSYQPPTAGEFATYDSADSSS